MLSFMSLSFPVLLTKPLSNEPSILSDLTFHRVMVTNIRNDLQDCLVTLPSLYQAILQFFEIKYGYIHILLYLQSCDMKQNATS